MERIVLIAQSKETGEYELLDSGDEYKLERFGEVLVSRPDPQALWARSLSMSHWDMAKAVFVRSKNSGAGASRSGSWRVSSDVPAQWPVHIGTLTLSVKPTAFKHMGVFPEQMPNWQWVSELIKKRIKDDGEYRLKVLNLFSYTGGASIAAAQAGAEVVHVDSSKTAVQWARENAEASGVGEKDIRFVVEDARAFVARELKRGNRYDAIIMDPPAFGHGVKREVWKIEEDLLPLIENCKKLLTENPLFLIINGYAAGYSPLVFAYNIESLEQRFGGSVQYGELTIAQTTNHATHHHLLPCGIFARWQSNM